MNHRSDSQLDPLLKLRQARRARQQRQWAAASTESQRREEQTRDLTDQIDSLATEMQQATKPGTLNLEALRQLDRLPELLRRQRRELWQQADEAFDLLETCRDELRRADQGVQVVERLKELRAAEERSSAIGDSVASETSARVSRTAPGCSPRRPGHCRMRFRSGGFSRAPGRHHRHQGLVLIAAFDSRKVRRH